MQPQPENPRPFFADTFKDWRVVEAYRHLPPYPAEVFEILTALMTDEPLTVLDVGAGSDDLARHLVIESEQLRREDEAMPVTLMETSSDPQKTLYRSVQVGRTSFL